MATYLAKGIYSAPGGVQGLLADGGTTRVKAARELVESVGGKLHEVYFAFGETDVYVIFEAPDAATAASISLTIAASGLATVDLVQLLTAQEIDAAVKMSPLYDAPGPTA